MCFRSNCAAIRRIMFGKTKTFKETVFQLDRWSSALVLSVPLGDFGIDRYDYVTSICLFINTQSRFQSI